MVMGVSSNSSLSTALHDVSRSLTDVVGPQQIDIVTRMQEQRANGIIVEYLLERVEEFRKLCQLREEGWKNPEGDQFFKRQRASADAGNPETARRFYDMMQRIGHELQNSTGILTVPKSQQGNPNFLDLCVAPGGFLHAAMELNRHASATAYSLPVEDGGHEVLLPEHHSIKVKLLDITMLAADLGLVNIPKEHLDRNNFLPREFSDGRVFDIVFCDGQVLRTHKRAAYREKREARRLTVTQLALGLEHVKPGGTIVILLHKLEAVDTVELLSQFNRFASITLFKPAKCHAKRSSFYLVASKIQTEHPEVITAIQSWKHTWAVATFGGDEDYEEIVRKDNSQAERILDDFGSELVRLGRKIWDIQARALAKAPFITGSSVRTGLAVQYCRKGPPR